MTAQAIFYTCAHEAACPGKPSQRLNRLPSCARVRDRHALLRAVYLYRCHLFGIMRPSRNRLPVMGWTRLEPGAA
jgi:hypothetical protein